MAKPENGKPNPATFHMDVGRVIDNMGEKRKARVVHAIHEVVAFYMYGIDPSFEVCQTVANEDGRTDKKDVTIPNIVLITARHTAELIAEQMGVPADHLALRRRALFETMEVVFDQAQPRLVASSDAAVVPQNGTAV